MYNSLEFLSSSSSSSGNTISAIENQRNFLTMHARLIGIATYLVGRSPEAEVGLRPTTTYLQIKERQKSELERLCQLFKNVM